MTSGTCWYDALKKALHFFYILGILHKNAWPPSNHEKDNVGRDPGREDPGLDPGREGDIS